MFSLEAEMVPVICRQLPTLLGTKHPFAQAQELPVNKRIVDIVAAPVDLGLLDSVRNITAVLPRLTMPQLDVLSLFAERELLSVQYLRQRTFLSARDLHNDYLTPFTQLGLVQRESKYTYASTGWASALPVLLVAIEAKLARWQEALFQATDNLRFADTSYAALDADVVSGSATIRQSYQAAGIGLISVAAEGVEVVVQPERLSGVIPDRHYQLIRLVRDLQMAHGKGKWILIH